MAEKTEWQKQAEAEAYRKASGQCGKEDTYECRLAYSMFLEGAEWQRNSVWHSIDEKADSSKFVVLYDVEGGYMSPPSRCMLGFDSMFIDAMNKKHGANYTMWAYKDDLVPMKEG